MLSIESQVTSLSNIIFYFPCLQGSEVQMQNITTQFLGSLSATQYNTIYRTVAKSLPQNQRSFTTDWVNETILSWCKNDSFSQHLSSGKTLTVPYLIKFIKSRNITIRDKWGKDALNRTFGLRTKDERKHYSEEEQIIRSSHSPAEVYFEVDEETEGVIGFDVADTSFSDKSDLEREVVDMRTYCKSKVKAKWKPYVDQFFDLYFQDLAKTDIADILGLDRNEIRQLFANIQEVAKKGREKGLL